MYKLIIADDETDIRQGLIEIVDWKKLGYELLAYFSDGREVIEYLENHHVDVILTDIKMSHLSGIDVAKYVYENKLPTKVMLLSGFREFDLAKMAIKYDVVDYLLKPTNFRELHSKFRELRLFLEEREKKLIEIHNEKTEMVNALKEQFFVDLTGGGIKEAEIINKRLKLIGLTCVTKDNYCGSLEFGIKDYDNFLKVEWQRGKNQLNTMLRNLFCGESNKLIYYLVRIHDQSLQLLFIEKEPSNEEIFSEKIDEFVYDLKKSIDLLIGLRFKELSRKVYSNVYNLVDENAKVLIPLDDKSEHIESLISPKDLEILYEQRNLFLSYSVAHDIKGMRDIFDTVLSKLALLELHTLQEFVIDLLVGLKNQMYSVCSKSYEILSKYHYQDLFTLSSIEEIEQWTMVLFNNLELTFKEYEETTDIKAIRDAKKYIEVHFSEDVSLEDVAEQVYLNPVYLSRLFKQETGENFIDYLIKVRMEEAKNLLENSCLKANEICERVGYSNAKYFYKIFKKYTGYTTSEYRSIKGR